MHSIPMEHGLALAALLFSLGLSGVMVPLGLPMLGVTVCLGMPPAMVIAAPVLSKQ